MSDEKAAKENKLVVGWSSQYGRPVTPTELQEINRNLSGFFSILLSWEKQFHAKGVIDDNGSLRS